MSPEKTNKEKLELFETYGSQCDYESVNCEKCNKLVGYNADKGRGLFLCVSCLCLLDK